MSKFELSDEQCLAFRQMRGNFNHMIRAIYQTGVNAALDEAARVADSHTDVGCVVSVSGQCIAGKIRGMQD